MGNSAFATDAGGDTGNTVVLRPDASILNAVGRGHTLASALADLIDNSIDAGATQVGVQFVTRDSTVRSIRIRDDGCGMTASQLEDAMSLGRHHEYSEKSQGHFGVGLKEASFSQARLLTVYSASGHEAAAGMRLARDQSGTEIRGERMDVDAAETMVRLRGLVTGSGTVVEWNDVENVSTATAAQARRRWFEAMMVDVLGGLGLTFHRLVADRRIGIELEELDEESGESGAPRRVRAIDPFAIVGQGATGYPRTLSAELADGVAIDLHCTILPPGAVGPSVVLHGRPRKDWQGLYVYRNDRLLHAGGWLSLHADQSPELQLARVAIDLEDAALDAVRMNTQKHGVLLRPAAVRAIETAVDDGFTLRSYWRDAEEVWRGTQSRQAKPRAVAVPGAGTPRGLDGLMRGTVGVRDDAAAAFTFDWGVLPRELLFSFEPTAGLITLNEAHRRRIGDPAILATLEIGVFFALERLVGRERVTEVMRTEIDAVHSAFASALLDPDGADDGWKSHETAVVHDTGDLEPLGDPAVADVHVDDDIMRDYLKAIGKKSLLDAEEEVELARAIEIGVLAQERLDAGPESRSLASDLRNLIAIGQKAFDHMVRANLRLVVSIAKRYQGQGLDFSDLIQEGNTGLIRAVHKFDYNVGTKFSTYATWWIRQAMTRALADQGRLIRFPVHIVDKLPAIRAAWEEATGSATQRLEATASVVSEKIGVVRSVINGIDPALSLDMPLMNEIVEGAWVESTLAAELVDSHDSGAHEIVEFQMLQGQLEALLDSLSEREAGVIRGRFGLGDGVPKTLEQLGDAFGVTRERIRQVEAEVMAKLRHPSRADGLRDYLRL